MKRSLISLFIFLILMSPAYALTISGRFINGETNQPIVNIGLAHDTEAGQTLLATSTSDGRFEISIQAVPGSGVIITVNPDNYSVQTTTTPIPDKNVVGTMEVKRKVYLSMDSIDYTGYIMSIQTMWGVPALITQFDIPNDFATISKGQIGLTNLAHKQFEKISNSDVVDLGDIQLWPMGEVRHCMASIQKPKGILLLDKSNLTQDEYDAINVGIYDGTLFPGVSPDEIHNLGIQEGGLYNVKLYKNLEYVVEDAGNCFLAISPQEGDYAETLIELVGLGYTPNKKYIISPVGKEVTSNSNGRIDATFKLIDTFPNSIARCSPFEGGHTTTTCQTAIAIHTAFGTLLGKQVFFVGTDNSEGDWTYKGREETISDVESTDVLNETFVNKIKLTETDSIEQTCTFLLNSAKTVTIKKGESTSIDSHGTTLFYLEVVNLKTIIEDGTPKELCKVKAFALSQNVIQRFLSWLTSLFGG